MAFPPPSSIALTTAEAALASFAYVIATFAPSAARRFAIAAPIPREPPVTSATLLASLDIGSPLVFLRLTHFILLTQDGCVASYAMRAGWGFRSFEPPSTRTVSPVI